MNHDTWQNETSAVIEVTPVCYEKAKEHFISFHFLPHSKKDLRHFTGVGKIYQDHKFRRGKNEK